MARPHTKRCIGSTILLCLCLGMALPVYAQENEVDTTRTEEQEPYKKTAGEVLVAIPGQILLIPVRILEGIAWGTIKLYEQPATQYLLQFESPRVFGAYPVAGYGSNPGLKLGLVLYNNRLLRDHDRFRIKGTYSTHKYQHYEAYYRSRRLRDAGLGFQVLARYRKRPRESFYGFGQESSADEEVNFTKEISYFRGDLAWQFGSSINIDGQVSYSAINISDGQDPNLPGDIDSILVMYGGTPADVRPTRFWTFGLNLLWDARNVRGQPTRGWYGTLGTSYNRGVDKSPDLEYWRTRLDLRYYLELFRKRTLILRGLVNLVDKPSDAPDLPFYLFSDLGGLDDLRAYRTNRLVDHDAVFGMAEYRYPIWDVIDAFVFFEAGHVYEKIGDEFSLRGWRTSYGFGFQTWHPESVLARTQVAFGAEGVRFYFELGTQLP